MFCNKCGTKNPEDSTVCKKCGSSISAEVTEETSSSEVPPKKRKRKLVKDIISVLFIIAVLFFVFIISVPFSATILDTPPAQKENTELKKEILGDWYLVGTIRDDTKSFEDIELDGDYPVYIFYEDGSYESGEAKGDYFIENNELYLYCPNCQNSVTGNFNIELKDGKLYLTNVNVTKYKALFSRNRPE